jgi:F-type H+-transporting ATPase subunit b
LETAIAQVANFFILLVVLRIFAYKPILKMLATRRRKIEEGLEASEESKKRLEETSVAQKAILLEAEQKALQVVSSAEEDARKAEARILEEAQIKSNHVLATGRKILEEDTRKVEEKIEKEAKEFVKIGVAKVIRNADVDDKLIAEALKELKMATK